MTVSPNASRELRDAYGHTASGVVAVCGLVDGEPVGMVASSFVPVSLDPPLVSFCAMRTSRTWRVLRAAPGLGVSVLGENHGDLCGQLSAPAGDRFAGIRWEAGESGAIFLHETALWLECSLDAEVDAGDHVIALLRLRRVTPFPRIRPLVFHRGRFERLEPVQAL